MSPEYSKYTGAQVANVVSVDAVHPDETIIERAAAVLRAGGLVAFPTETVYGLGADATNHAAVARIFTVKRRPFTDPLIVHVASIDDVPPLVADFPATASTLARAFWPGPLTLVLPRSVRVVREVSAGLDTVAIRVPAHPVAHALVRAAAVPVAAPSANLFSCPSPTRAEHVVVDLGSAVDLILDAGPTPVGLESTVVDLTTDPPAVLRPGGVSVERLREILPSIVVKTAHASGAAALPSPGMLTRHYAPRTPLTLFEGVPERVLERVGHEVQVARSNGQRIVVLATTDVVTVLRRTLDEHVMMVDLGDVEHEQTVASSLYQSLRDADALGADRILAFQVTSERGLSLAVRDRLRRASAGSIVSL